MDLIKEADSIFELDAAMKPILAKRIEKLSSKIQQTNRI